MSILPPRSDWSGSEWPASTMEVARAEGIANRIRGEIAEMRAAAERLGDGGPFETAVAEFLTVQATLLERCGGTARRAEMLRADEDTREVPGMFPSTARCALLIARAIPDRASHEGYDQGGGWTTHAGRQENCPAPECQDRTIEQGERAAVDELMADGRPDAYVYDPEADAARAGMVAATMEPRAALEDMEEVAVAHHPAFCDCCICLSLEPGASEDVEGEIDEEWRDA